jgi:hypothetical protein
MGTFLSPNPGSSTDEDEVAILEAQDLANAHDTWYRHAMFSSYDEDEHEKEEQEEDIDVVRHGRTRRLQSEARIDFKLGGKIILAGVRQLRRGSSAEQKAASGNRFGSDQPQILYLKLCNSALDRSDLHSSIRPL